MQRRPRRSDDFEVMSAHAEALDLSDIADLHDAITGCAFDAVCTALS